MCETWTHPPTQFQSSRFFEFFNFVQRVSYLLYKFLFCQLVQTSRLYEDVIRVEVFLYTAVYHPVAPLLHKRNIVSNPAGQ